MPKAAMDLEDLNTLSLNENEITITDYIVGIMNGNNDDEEDEIVEYIPNNSVCVFQLYRNLFN